MKKELKKEHLAGAGGAGSAQAPAGRATARATGMAGTVERASASAGACAGADAGARARAPRERAPGARTLGARTPRSQALRALAAIVCAAMLAAALSACGASGGTAPQGGATAATTQAAVADATQAATESAQDEAGAGQAEASADAAASGAATEPAAPAAETAEAAAEEPYKFTFFNNIFGSFSDGDQAVFDKLMAETNTVIELQNMPSSSYEESLTVMMASGDYPELVMFPDYTKPVFLDGVEYKAVLPLNDYIANAPNVQKYTYPISFKVLSVMGDGQIYGIPRTSIARADGYMIRQDWLDRLGIGMTEGEPVTLAAFTDILRAFSQSDPDGNGANDTFGLGLYTADGNLEIPTALSYTFGLNGWQEYPGEDYKYMDPKYSRQNDSFKNALEYMNALWNDKLVDPDWPTLNLDAHKQRFEQGITGMRAEFVGYMLEHEQNLQNVNPDARLSYMVGIVQNEGDKVAGGTYSTGVWGHFSVMSSAKNPQKIVDVLDYMLSDNFWEVVKFGVEGVSWEFDAEGTRVAIPNTGSGGRFMRRNEDASFFISLNTPGSERPRLEKLIDICIGQAVFSKDEGFRPAIASDPAFLDADKELKTSVSKIIVGDLPIGDYNAVLDKWYDAGGRTYVEQMNEGIAAAE
ncbi:MAG: extracellular solute-binding protein [Clostridiales bacterium]|jgi:putative aldouronate transport system substrate-binding protein|nr:extracellular solute-binding protein [Clostridiales bacterium]